MPGVILPSRMPQVGRPVGGSAPDPTFLEGVTSTFASSDYAETRTAREKEAMDAAMAQIVSELERRGLRSDGYTKRDPRDLWSLSYDENAVWSGIAAARARDPKAFAGIPATPEAYRATTIAPVHQRFDREMDTAKRSGWGGWLAGSFAYGLTDPVNQIAMMAGAAPAKTIGQAILRDTIINTQMEAAQQPVRAFEKASRGEELTPGEALSNVLIAGGTGAIGGGLFKSAELHAAPAFGRAVAGAREQLLAGVWDIMPKAVRERWASAADVTDADMPDLAELAIGRQNMSADERAAADVVRRETDIERTNPFEPDGAGLASHKERMADAMSRILADTPAAEPRARFAGDLRSSTGLASGTVSDLPARAALKNRIAVVESSGGRHYANPLSSARGKYQFLQSTWLSYYTRRFGRGGLSNAEILAKRSDGQLQDVLMDDLLADNASFLRRRGEPETAGNLYLVHFAGQGGARRLFEADPSARASGLLGERVIAANPFLRDMTAGDVIAWAHGKMGEAGSARPARGVGDATNTPLTDQLRGDIDRLSEEQRALETTSRVDEPVFVDTGDVPMPRAAEMQPETLALLPDLRGIVNDRGRSINDFAAIGRDLGIGERDARQLLMEMVKARELRMSRTGVFSRPPRSKGPVDALKFVARLGVRNDEGHALGRNGRDLDIFVPGAGPLIRKSGKSVDAIGEALWDAGYFGPPKATERPDENAVLDLIERIATGEKIYPHGVEAPRTDGATAGSFFDARERVRLTGLFGKHAEDIGVNVDDGLLQAAAKVYDGLDPAKATPRDGLLGALHDLWEDLRLDVWHETKDGPDGIFDDGLDAAFDGGSGAGRGVGQGPDTFPGDAGEGRAAGEAGGRDAETLDPTPISPEAAQAFDDPVGPAAQAQADSLEHDLRATVDPAIAERRAQQAALKAASPMRAAVDQESTIGSPLFDAADQGGFRLDEEGAGRSVADILAELDDEAIAIKNVKDCL